MNFIFPADNRVNFSLLCRFGQILAEFIKGRRFAFCLFACFGRLTAVGFSAADCLHKLLNQRPLVNTRIIDEFDGIGIRFFKQGEQQVLCADKRMHHTSCNLKRKLNDSF